MTRHDLFATAIMLLCATAVSAQPVPAKVAAAPQALAFFNQNPTVQIYGLPRAAGYTALADGQQQLAFHLSQSSHFIKQDSGDESLLFDGATTRAALVYKRGFGKGWQLSATLPFVAHSGGFADSLVEGFHRAFGLDLGGRNQTPDGQQHFRYSRDGQTLLAVDDSPSGIGDIRLTLKKRLAGYGDWGASVAAQLKLPTGDADELTGSGGTDLAIWGVIGNNQDGQSPWRMLAAVGLLYTSDGDVLPALRRNIAGFGWLTLGYAVQPHVVISGQLYVHSALYEDTDLEALDGVAVQGALGVHWQVTPSSIVSAAFIEDLNAGVSPDVALALAVEHTF